MVKKTDLNSVTEDVYFFVKEDTKKCFLEELPGETIVKAEFSYIDADSESHPMNIVLYDPKERQLLRSQAQDEGRIAHHAMDSGYHKICLEPTLDQSSMGRSIWPPNSKEVKFKLRIEVQPKEVELDDHLARKNHLTLFEREVQMMEHKLDLLLKDLEYSEQQEKHFTDQSERINSHIVYWSFFQVSSCDYFTSLIYVVFRLFSCWSLQFGKLFIYVPFFVPRSWSKVSSYC